METLFDVQASTIKMPTTDFIALDEVFCQRNTQARVIRTAKRLVNNPLPTHSMVILARYPNGKLVKLDGNTRSLAWEMGLVEAPEHVNATIFNVQNDAEAKNLYESIDSQDAVERSKDKVWSAMQIVYGPMYEIFETPTIKNGKFVSALRHSLVNHVEDGRKQRGLVRYGSDIATYVDWINYFKWELAKLDQLLQAEEGHYRVNQSQLNVALVLLKKYGLENERLNSGLVRWFSCNFTAVETSKTGNKIDPISWMQHHLNNDLAYANAKGTGGDTMALLLDYHLAFFEAWMDGKLMGNNPHAKKPTYIHGYHKKWYEDAKLRKLQSSNLM